MSTLARLVLPLLALCVQACAVESAPPAGGLVIAGTEDDPRPYFHDFGRVPHGRVLEHTYELVNEDPVPVTIRNLQAACGCTVPAVHAVLPDGTRIDGNVRARGEILTVPPGGTVFVAMRVDTTEVDVPNRDKLSLVRMTCDSRTTPFITFEMHLIVERLFQATPERIDLGRIAETVGGSGFTELAPALPGGEARVLEVLRSDPELEVELTESVRFGIPVWTLTARLPAGRPLGPHTSVIELSTTDSEGVGEAGRFRVGVGAQVVNDILVDPPTAHLGHFPRDAGGALEVRVKSLVPGHRFRVVGHELAGAGADEVEVSVAPVSPDDAGRASEWTVTLSVPAGAALDAYSGHVTLRLDDPQYPTLDLPYSGTVAQS